VRKKWSFRKKDREKNERDRKRAKEEGARERKEKEID
jgi:hypothetical protein